MSDQSINLRPDPFYYCAKASRSERDKGLDHLFWKHKGDSYVRITEEEYNELEGKEGVLVTTGSIHPTIKPVEVMEWLVDRLSEPGDTILDPFAGSGTTGIASMRKGRSCKLIELDGEGLYRDIIEGRLHGWRNEMLDELPPHEHPEIKFGGDLPDEDPKEVPNEISMDALFDFG